MSPFPSPEHGQPSLASTLIPGRRPSKDRVIALGGFSNPGDGARAQREVFGFDLKAGRWEALPALLPSPRTQMALAQHDGALWVLGGVDYDSRRPRGEAFQFPRDVLRWRPGEEAFAVAGELPRPRRAFGCATLDGRAWLVGGMRESFRLVSEVDVLDLETGAWTAGPTPARARVSPELVAFRGRLWLAGGSSLPRPGASVSEVEEDRTVDVLDPDVGAWEVAFTLPVSTRHASIFAWRDRLLLYSAHLEDASAVRLLVVDPAPRAGDEHRRTRDLVAEHQRRLADELEHLTIEHEAFVEDAAGKSAAWRDVLGAHGGVVEDYRQLVARNQALLTELLGISPRSADGAALSRIEGASREPRAAPRQPRALRRARAAGGRAP